MFRADVGSDGRVGSADPSLLGTPFARPPIAGGGSVHWADRPHESSLKAGPTASSCEPSAA